MESFGQGFASMSAPTKELERLVLDKKINHAGNPILRWMCGNLQMKLDPAGNIKMDKAKSKEKIDGMVALCMGLGSYMNREEDDNSGYEERGIVFF
jgi:phage terminase large subunit-like protein